MDNRLVRPVIFFYLHTMLLFLFPYNREIHENELSFTDCISAVRLLEMGIFQMEWSDLYVK